MKRVPLLLLLAGLLSCNPPVYQHSGTVLNVNIDSGRTRLAIEPETDKVHPYTILLCGAYAQFWQGEHVRFSTRSYAADCGDRLVSFERTDVR